MDHPAHLIFAEAEMVALVDERHIRRLQPDGDRQQPLAAARDDRLVHEHAVREAPRLRPVRPLRLRVLRDDSPYAAAAIPMPRSLRPEEPHPPLWIAPKARVKRAHKAY